MKSKLSSVEIFVLALVLILPGLAFAVGEAQLDSLYYSEIQPYFTSHAVRSDFAGVDGVKISYAIIQAPEEKAALVILPGRGESYIKYLEFVYDLRNSGLSLYLMDHRGQGFSGRMTPDTQKGYVKSYEDYIVDVQKFINDIVKAHPHKKLFILGHSMGGGIGAVYAERYPNGLDGVILSSPMLGIDTGKYPEPVAYYLAKFLDFIGKGDDYAPGKGRYSHISFEENGLTHSLFRYERRLKDHGSFPAIVSGGPAVRWVKEAMKLCYEAQANAAKLETPVLLLQAGQERIVLNSAEDMVCEKAENCRKVIFPVARHEILMEKDDTRNAALKDILSFIIPLQLRSDKPPG